MVFCVVVLSFVVVIVKIGALITFTEVIAKTLEIPFCFTL